MDVEVVQNGEEPVSQAGRCLEVLGTAKLFAIKNDHLRGWYASHLFGDHLFASYFPYSPRYWDFDSRAITLDASKWPSFPPSWKHQVHVKEFSKLHWVRTCAVFRGDVSLRF